MSKVVFILGAGCSQECGAPLMADFLDIAYNLRITGQVNNVAEHFDRVFKAIVGLQSVHSKSQLDITNIESIFNAFEIANTLNKLPTFTSQEIPQVVNSLKKVIVSTLEKTVKFPTSGGRIDAPFAYGPLAYLVDQIREKARTKYTVSIMTFNYDIAMDIAMFRYGLGVNYCFDNVDSPGSVPLLKLHGSLNWAAKSGDGQIIPLTISQYFQKYNLPELFDGKYCTLPIGSQLSEYFQKYTDIIITNEPVIVPPSWNKAEYHSTLSKVWNRAAKELTDAEYIFILGYSLPETDAFFRLLYALGTVGNNPLKKIEIYNPENSGQTKKRFEDIIGPGAKARFKYYPTRFSDAISLITPYFPV